ncbi:SAM-dependent methyltransferase [Archangium lansingense]|uniref:Methyltransferase domain-containing protein n=1 Tax=Archangium lansingense TaxID=2995310 RepID=A0ABT4AI04_9BACT|nr:methyltransferase domain-containing protein [Archangium lansinium]MCY1081265.1 methyltransferase domain-containing protein [Archangium lansinium]
MGIRKATVGIALLSALGLAGGAPAVGQEGEFIYKPPNLGRSDLPERAPDVPYVPTPQGVVDAMLELADVKPGDVLYDLGSGDGRIVVTAAQRFGVRGVGIDINPERVQEAEANAKAANVEQLTDFRQEDLFKSDFGEATVVTMYLLPSVNNRLKPKLLEDLKPGTRIVSHAFDIEGWEPDRIVEADGSTLYLWIVPENPSHVR